MEDRWLSRALERKRDGAALDAATWERIVEEYAAGRIDDAPVAALAMACAIRGMDDAETDALTAAMVASGDTIAFPRGAVPVVDKHSSGGVGDSVSLVAVPLVAACGVRVAKLSGRALGHTGGTLDKLEAIPGVRTALEPDAFVAQVERVGCAIAAQSARLVPADKKLYALRDRTGTVASTGLIAASIVSKKIAGGAEAIVFDVKAGRGAFMHTVGDAVHLARALVRLVARFGRRASALVSDMEEPLGAAVGSGIEAIEARDFLSGARRDTRLAAGVDAVAREMLRVAGIDGGDAAERLRRALEGGAAYERFVQLIEAQGGTRTALESAEPNTAGTPARAARDGIVAAIDATAIGELARDLTSADGPFAGIRIAARVGTAVRAGDTLAECYGASADARAVAGAFTIGDTAPPELPIVAAVVRDAHVTVPGNEA